MSTIQISGVRHLVLMMCIVLSACESAAPSQSQKAGASPEPQSSGAHGSETKDIAGEVIWNGDGGGLRIIWTTTDLYKRSGSETESIWGPLVQTGLDDFVAVVLGNQPDKKNPERCSYERRFKVLSVVGTLVSFEDQYQDDCGGAHPSADTRFTAVDLAKPGEVRYARQDDTPMMNIDLAKAGPVVKLSDYFSERDILRALLAEPTIQRALATLDDKKQPQSLAELPALFKGDDYALGDLDFELRPDFLTRFSFHHIEGKTLAVRIGLPPHSGASRTLHKELEVFLPIPESLQEPLNLAAARRQGFLMSDAAQIAGNQLTVFRRTTGDSGNGGK
jgi:hypothetical protein